MTCKAPQYMRSSSELACVWPLRFSAARLARAAARRRRIALGVVGQGTEQLDVPVVQGLDVATAVVAAIGEHPLEQNAIALYDLLHGRLRQAAVRTAFVTDRPTMCEPSATVLICTLKAGRKQPSVILRIQVFWSLSTPAPASPSTCSYAVDRRLPAAAAARSRRVPPGPPPDGAADPPPPPDAAPDDDARLTRDPPRPDRTGLIVDD